MKAIYDHDPRPSAFLPLAELMDDPDLVAFMEAGSVGDPMPNIPEMNAVWQAWGDAMKLVSNQTQEPARGAGQCTGTGRSSHRRTVSHGTAMTPSASGG